MRPGPAGQPRRAGCVQTTARPGAGGKDARLADPEIQVAARVSRDPRLVPRHVRGADRLRPRQAGRGSTHDVLKVKEIRMKKSQRTGLFLMLLFFMPLLSACRSTATPTRVQVPAT